MCCVVSYLSMPHMILPAINPDLNPIEPCDQLKQRLDDSTPHPSDLEELHVALVEEWNTLHGQCLLFEALFIIILNFAVIIHIFLILKDTILGIL
uniref:Uncharacterized protein n=1 Tax=Oryzias sinensis TaxID=183150 RepID=A0A8C8DMA6_9TELE